ncbi:MAG TPA: hypothetical protein VFI42_06575 [Thermomicrobiaceae bacterium]|nr:hypothetical protein [Thermomicrobiaceae bacterium]
MKLTERRGEAVSEEDVAATLEAIRAAVRARAHFGGPDEVPTPLDDSPVANAANRARVSAHFYLYDDVPIIGGPITMVKRVIRLGLRWYINPIVEQQNQFNEAVVRALRAIEERQAELERRLAPGARRGDPDEA